MAGYDTSFGAKFLTTGAAEEFPVRDHNILLRKFFHSPSWGNGLRVTNVFATRSPAPLAEDCIVTSASVSTLIDVAPVDGAVRVLYPSQHQRIEMCQKM